MENNTTTFFDTIVKEFSGKEFTKEELIDKLKKEVFSNKTIDDNVWSSKNGFSIVNSYPELSDEEFKMLSEIMGFYNYTSSNRDNGIAGRFIDTLKRYRKNISQWHDYIFSKALTEEHDKNSTEIAYQLKGARTSQRVWPELYSNEEYCKKIIENDKKRYYLNVIEELEYKEKGEKRIEKKVTNETRKTRLMNNLGLNEQ